MKHGRDLIINGEIILAGTVLSDYFAGWMWEEDAYFCPKMLREALSEIGDGPVTIRLSSYGGHVEAGEAMRKIISSHKGGVTVVVEGVAMSAATFLMMGAARREMSEGSLFMIHDPSGGAWGTQYDLRQEADLLEKLTVIAADIYAKVSGQSVEDIRAAMAAETFYTAQEALDAGFIDAITGAEPDEEERAQGRIVGAPQSNDDARAQMAASASWLAQRLKQNRTKPDGPARAPAAQRGATAQLATREESVMTRPNPADPSATPTPAPTAPQTAVDNSAAIAAERERAVAIQTMAQPFINSGRIAQTDVTALIENGTTAEMASRQLLSAMAGAEPPVSRTTAHITRDEGETRMEGMIGALMGSTEGPAQQFRGMRLRRLAIELAGGDRGFSDIDSIRRGMTARTMTGGAHGVSDFAYITTEVMNRSLMNAYQRRAAVWTSVCGAPLSAADFRELHAVRFGGDFQMKKVLENGEYESAVLDDEAEGLKVERRGRTIKLTFEAVVNDDMGAFARIPTEFAMAARMMENQMVWSLIRNNAVLKSDNTALFHTSRSNTVAAAAISVTTVGAARKRMWEQRAFGTKDKDDFMQVEPNRLIVPPALEVEALKFTGATVPTKDDDGNPFKTTLSPIVVPNLGAAAGGHDNRWYLISSDLPPIAHAYLEGYEAPTVVTVEGLNPDVVTMNARHIFGAAAVEPRGAQRIGQ